MKRTILYALSLRRAFLVIFSCLVFAVAFIFPQAPANAAGPYHLRYSGNNASFPTWQAGVKTKLCVKNHVTNYPAKATVQAGNQRESIDVPNGKTVCINRDWGGWRIGVVNSSEGYDRLISVWTE